MGRPLSITDQNGVVTDLEYNARGWLTKSTVRHGTGDAVTTIEYSLAGDVTKVTLPDGSFLAYAYDDARRLTAVTNQAGEKVEFTYDLARNVTAQVTKDSGGTVKRTQSRAYDEPSRLLRLVGAATQTTTFGYDNNSNLVSLTDPLNKTTGFGFDALNRLITATNPLMGVRTTGYDPQGNVVMEADERRSRPATSTTASASRSRRRARRRHDRLRPRHRRERHAEDRRARAGEHVELRCAQPHHGHHLLGRSRVQHHLRLRQHRRRQYGIGRLTSVTDVSGQTALKYDHCGNVVREDRTIGGTLYTTEYSYDLADNLIGMVYPSGRIVTYVRDALGRVTSVTTKNNAAATVNVATAITYMPFGPIASSSTATHHGHLHLESRTVA
ncbi:MAG: hypothetical protein U1F37_14055 [Alphaproteobacteria bacterium]